MHNKQPDIQQPIHALLAERWSPRAFDIDRPIEAVKLQALLEAARWAPSCFNDQPWRFIVCNRHTDEAAWETAAAVLADKNQLWARQAPLLMLVCSEGFFSHNGNENRWAHYDTGAAGLSICLQATALGLFTHQMGGFDLDAARTAFAIPDSVTPMAMMAVGYQGRIENLDAGFVEAEQQARARKPVDKIVFEGRWG
jgi:nitroreductase